MKRESIKDSGGERSQRNAGPGIHFYTICSGYMEDCVRIKQTKVGVSLVRFPPETVYVEYQHVHAPSKELFHT